MSEVVGSDVSLAVVRQDQGTEVWCQALVDRLRDGREQEVLTYLREAPLDTLRYLDRSWGPWDKDTQLWWALQQPLSERGIALTCNRSVIKPDAAFAARVLTHAKSLLVDAKAPRREERATVIVSKLLPFCVLPNMPWAERLALLDWIMAVRQIANLDRYDYFTDWESLLSGIKQPEQFITLAGYHPKLADEAIKVFGQLAEKLPPANRWQPWHEFFALSPRFHEDMPVYDPELIEHCWKNAEPAAQERLLYQFGRAVRYCEKKSDWSYFEASFDRMFARNPKYFVHLLSNDSRYWLEPHLAKTIWAKQYPELVALLLPGIGECTSTSGYSSVLSSILDTRPGDLEKLTSAQLTNLLPELKASLSPAVLQGICKVMAGSSSKALREALAKALAKVPLADLDAAGWFNIKGKNALLGLRDVLLGHSDPAAAIQLQALLDGGKLDIASSGIIEAHLNKLGLGSKTPRQSQGASLAELEQQAAKVKRIAAATRHYDTPELLALLEPLSEHAARVLLHLAATAEEALPSLAHELMAQVPAQRRAQLAHSILATWISLDGDPKARWALRLLSGNIDDRVVDVLADAALAWGKPKKQRAVLAVEQLAALDSLYALARVQEIAGSRKVKDMVSYAARQALREAAARRNLSVAELYDELTPDFGLAEGITLKVGECIYRVVLQGDLSLRVVDDKGKESKSLPALKDEALRDEWETASAQYKTLQAGLKSVLKQQAPRMQAAFFTGKSWTLERWQRLFLAHPLLRVAGRSLIWGVLGKGGKAQISFRIAEDFSLLDVEDNRAELPADVSICLWHPVTAAAGEAEAWKTSLEDYRIEALVDQVGALASLPDASRFKDGQLLPDGKLVVAQGKLSGVLSKCGYKAGPVEDGPGIYHHDWLLPAASMLVRLSHSTYMPYMDLENPVTIEAIEVYVNSKLQKPSAIPKPLLATLEEHLQRMKEKAMA